MTVPKIARLLDQLDQLKRNFDSHGNRQIGALLNRIRQVRFQSAEDLARFHETLLFLRAYPQSAAIVRLTESLLRSVPARIEALTQSGADVAPLNNPEVSGIAGTSVTDTFSYYIVRWLLRRHPTQVAFDWNWFEDENRLASTWPRFMPLLEEDSQVEANVPYREWLRAARDREGELAWLVGRMEQLPISEKEQAELFDSQKLYVRWRPSYRATRTGMRLIVRKIFYHRAPLIPRRSVSFPEELGKLPPSLVRLNKKQGERILDLARETSTIRYRELYGFTHGDPERVLQAEIGRGTKIFVVGLPAEKRLPLRTYHAAIIFKNGVPIGYFEGLSLFERLESGFNLYYGFREGETAWIYARTLNIFRHLLGVTAISIDPYQIGYENEEGIESGAFWFYRKLGFRPTRPNLRRLTEEEERKLSLHASYRTSARTLRKLATGPMIFELDRSRIGDWDKFQLRQIGFAVQQRMASQFEGKAVTMRAESVKTMARIVGIRAREERVHESQVFQDFGVVLALIPDLTRWSKDEKELLLRVLRAKAGRTEDRYLKLMQRHERLRAAIIKLGSQN